MQKKLLTFFATFSFAVLAKAQYDSPFDRASVVRGLSKVTTLNSDMTKVIAPGSCPTNKPGTSPIVACGTTSEDFNNTVVTKVEFEPGKIDPRLYSVIPEEFRKDTKDKKTACLISFRLENDNKEMIGSGTPRTGDDAGRTHSLGLSVSCSSEDGLSKTFSYDSELTSQPEMQNGKYTYTADQRAKQKFNTETIFSFVQDNINQNKVTYWKRGFGFINMTDKKTLGPLSAANQQEWFHATLNKLQGEGRAITYQYEEGSLNKWGPFVTMSVGLQQHANLGNRCHISMAAETGFRLGTLKDSSYWNASANSKVSFDITKGTAVYLRGSFDATTRPGSSFVQQRSAALGLNSIKSGTFIEMGTSKQVGNRRDVLDIPNMYTGKNDSLIFLKLGVGF